MLRSVRDLVLAIYALTWATVVIIITVRTGTVPETLLAALGIGIGAILGAFQLDDRGRRRRTADADRELEESSS